MRVPSSTRFLKSAKNCAGQFHAATPSDDDVFTRYSRITYADRIDTPTLIIHGEKDECCGVGQDRELHRALKGRVPVRLAIYPGEGHGLRKKEHVEDYLGRVIDWFHTYLGWACRKSGLSLTIVRGSR